MSDGTTNVDLAQLEQAAGQLDSIKQFLETHCLGYMPAISEALGSASNIDMSHSDYQFTREATVFGAFYSAYGMQARHDRTYRAVQASLQQLIQYVDQAANNVRQIRQSFQTHEDLQEDAGRSFQRTLGDYPSSGSTYA